MLILLLAGLVAFLAIVYWTFELGHWRHDSYLYRGHKGMLQTVLGDGRWFAYLFTKWSPEFNPWALWSANYLLTISGLTLIFYRLFGDRLLAINLAIIISLYPGFYAQNMWPLAITSAAILFPLSVFCVQRTGAVLLPLLALPIFGSMQYFYYFLPLAFLPLGHCRTIRDASEFITPGIVWGVGLILAYLFACLVNYYRFDEFGIQLAEWRNAHPAEDLSTLATNIAFSANNFSTQITQWLPIWSILILVVTVIVCLLNRNLRAGDPLTLVMRGSYALIVMICPYLTVLQAGINVQARSLLPTAAAIVVLPFLLTNRSAHRPLLLVVAIAVGVPSLMQTHAQAEWYSRLTSENIENLERAVKKAGADEDQVVVDARHFPAYYQYLLDRLPNLPSPGSLIISLDQPYKLLGGAVGELGFQQKRICPTKFPLTAGEPLSKTCKELLPKDPATHLCKDRTGPICTSRTSDEYLLIQLLPAEDRAG